MLGLFVLWSMCLSLEYFRQCSPKFAERRFYEGILIVTLGVKGLWVLYKNDVKAALFTLSFINFHKYFPLAP